MKSVINSMNMIILLIYCYHCFNSTFTLTNAQINELATNNNQKQESNVPQQETNLNTEASNHRYFNDEYVINGSAESLPITITSDTDEESKSKDVYTDYHNKDSLTQQPQSIAYSNYDALDDNNKKSIYSSLVKILYHMKQQFDNSNNQLKKREDNNKSNQQTTKPPKAVHAGIFPTSASPETTIKSSLENNSLHSSKLKSINRQGGLAALATTTTTTREPSTTILEVTNEPFVDFYHKTISPLTSSSTESSLNNYIETQSQSPIVVTERNDDIGNVQRDSFTASDHIEDNIITLRDRYDRKVINNQQPRFSTKLNTEKLDLTTSSYSSLPSEKVWTTYPQQTSSKGIKLDSDRYNSIDKPLFSLTSTFNDNIANSYDENQSSLQNFNTIYDNLSDTNDLVDQTTTVKITQPTYTNDLQSNNYAYGEYQQSRPSKISTTTSSKPRLKFKNNAYNSKNKSKQSLSINPNTESSTTSFNSNSQLNRKNSIRQIKPGEYYNSVYGDQRQSLLDQSGQQQQHDDVSGNGMKYSIAQASGYSESYANPSSQLANSRPYSGVHLQQIYGQPVTSQQQSQYIQQQAQQYQQQQQQLQQQNSFGGVASSGRQFNQPVVSQSTTSYGMSPPNMIASSTTSQNEQQRDLLNQPQTIQITAVPNGFPLINGLRVNGYGINNGLVGNGLLGNGLFGLNGMNGFLDPSGRQVVMVNAERRQIDWSFWIWPLLIVIALPLVLGALFVPVFLKTIVILIQVLQSLGLLLPITNAINQQIAQATGVSTSATTTQVEQTKT